MDAIDNGVNQYLSEAPPLYESNTHLAARVARLNPDWLEEQSPEKQDASFLRAMNLAGEEFLEVGVSMDPAGGGNLGSG